MAFCIIPELAQKLKQAAAAGEITMEKLFDMSSDERRQLFGKYADNETAQQINAGFEKAMASSQQSVLNNWVKRTFTAQEKQSSKYHDVISKIDALNKEGVLTPSTEKAYLSDLVATKLGATITSDEAKTIAEGASKLAELQKEIPHGIGDPTANPEGQIAYLREREKMTNYLLSLTPASNIRVAIGTIGRGMMVSTIHSPVLNIIAHSVISLPEMIGRRIESREFKGLNNDFWRKYSRNADKLFNATGYDVSRFEALGGEKKSLGEDYAHSQGPGMVRWMGRAVENTVFKHLHGNLYEMFAARHFSDSANLRTTAIAKAEGLTGEAAKTRALEISKDASLIDPKTPLGQHVRAQAQADALYATFTNKSAVSDAALGLRAVANKATGEFRLGDATIPFAKVPANALGASLEYAGVNMTAKLALGIGKTIAGVIGREPFDKANFAGMQRTFVRAGLGLTFAFAISELIHPKDFIGAYPTNPSEQKLLSERNATPNSIKVGDKWVSLDYLANEGSSLLGILYAKKFGVQTPLDAIFRYAQGPENVLQNVPGLPEIAALYKYLNTPPSQKANAGAFAQTETKALLGQLTSRIVPGLVSDIAKMSDQYNRSVDKNSIFAQVQSNIPGLREGLPIARNLFGDAQKTEPWLSTLLFGARVKTAQDSQLLNELVRLNQAGELPSITDVAKTSTSAQQLKTQIGTQKFDEAMQYFGKNLKQNMTDTINTDEYKQADSPLAQKRMLDKVKASTLKDTLDTYGYQKPEKK
jgi:hypothetical protein